MQKRIVLLRLGKHFPTDRIDRPRLTWLNDEGVSLRFSFSADGPLDMRMDPTQGQSASELIAQLSEAEHAPVFVATLRRGDVDRCQTEHARRRWLMVEMVVEKVEQPIGPISATRRVPGSLL